MRYIKELVIYSQEINKSEFIAILYPLQKIEDILVYLQDARQRYPKANHYCYASLYGMQGEQQSASDDGEPLRTAGIPILDVLKHHDVTHVLCVVIRYFGGIKLGAGGLVRAYTSSAAEVIKRAQFYKKIQVPTYEISFNYQHLNTIDYYLKEKATTIDKVFSDRITYHLYLKPNYQDIEEIRHLLLDIKLLEPKLLFIDE